MKLVKIFDLVNQIKKSSFFKLLDSFTPVLTIFFKISESRYFHAFYT